MKIILFLAGYLLFALSANATEVANKEFDLFGNGKPLSVTQQDRQIMPNASTLAIKKEKAKIIFKDGNHTPSPEMIDLIVHLGTAEENKYAERYVRIQEYKTKIQARIATATAKARKHLRVDDTTKITPTLLNVKPSNDWRLMWIFSPTCHNCKYDVDLVQKITSKKLVKKFAIIGMGNAQANKQYATKHRLPGKIYRNTWQVKQYQAEGTPIWIFDDRQNKKIYKIFGADHDETVFAYINRLNGKGASE